MKRNLLLLLSCAALGFGQSTVWHLDPAHSAAQFSVRHMGISTVRGTFTKVNGTATYDPADVSKTSLDITIDAASVDSRVEMRDNDLRSDHFLDVAKYPVITFVSKGAEVAGEGKLKIRGDLTLHGVTKPVILNVDGPSGPIKDPMRGGSRMGASATTTINRSDFGMNGMRGAVGDEIAIVIDVELSNGNGQRPPMPNGAPPKGAAPSGPPPSH
jgi:polyisoprenoid-binding protein YceI